MEPSPGDGDRLGLLGTWCGDSDPVVRVAGDRVVGAGGGRTLRVVRDADQVRSGEDVQVHPRAGAGGVRPADVPHLPGREGGDGRRQVAGVVDGVLVDGVEQGVHVRRSLRVAGAAELLGRVDGHDHDGRKDGDDTDDEQELDEGEARKSTMAHGGVGK